MTKRYESEPASTQEWWGNRLAEIGLVFIAVAVTTAFLGAHTPWLWNVSIAAGVTGLAAWVLAVIVYPWRPPDSHLRANREGQP